MFQSEIHTDLAVLEVLLPTFLLGMNDGSIRPLQAITDHSYSWHDSSVAVQ